MGRSNSRNKTRCPECLISIALKDDIELWDPINCPDCHTILQVIRLHPVKLDYMDSDWGDEEWDDDDWDDDDW